LPTPTPNDTQTQNIFCKMNLGSFQSVVNPFIRNHKRKNGARAWQGKNRKVLTLEEKSVHFHIVR
jgi:hypothetical protein